MREVVGGLRYRDSVILQPLPVPPGPAVLGILPHLERALAGTAAWLPLPTDDPHRAELLRATQRPGEAIDSVALVVPTSGSTGTPKGSQLSAAHLTASADATAARIGTGQWLLALPASHIAGLQVLLRSIHAGTTPVVLPPGGSFADAAERMTGARRLTSIVPLQLSQLLDDALGVDALRTFDAVLCGGQATPPALVKRARQLGVNVVLTYGSSETAGGCVYDGRPLAGVDIAIAGGGRGDVGGGGGDVGGGGRGDVAGRGDVGRIELTGPMVAHGYRNVPGSADFRLAGSPPGPQAVGGQVQNTFITSDLGRITSDGVLEVLGRADDVINSGGLKILPTSIESELAQHPGVAACVVVAAPHPELGEQAVALVVPGQRGPENAAATAGVAGPELKAWLADRVHRHLIPRAFVQVATLPTVGPGKVDRQSAQRMAVEALGLK